MRCLSILGMSFVITLTACQSTPPVVLKSDLEAMPALAELRPVDVVVLPIEDASVDQSITPYLEAMRKQVAEALVVQRYSPLALDTVDRGLGKVAGSPVDPVYLGSIVGSFGADAVLGIKIRRWHAGKIMQDGRIDFSAEIFMMASEGKQPLWRGQVDGSIKAGGDGPSPLGESRRFESTAALFAKHIIAELPQREL